MKKQKVVLPRLIAAIQISGSVAVLFIVSQVIQSWAVLDTEMRSFNIIFSLLCLFGMGAGIYLWKGRRLGVLLSSVFQAIQVPFFETYLVTYEFFCPIKIAFALNPPDFGFVFSVQTYFSLDFFHEGYWMIGINFFPLLMLWGLTYVGISSVDEDSHPSPSLTKDV